MKLGWGGLGTRLSGVSEPARVVLWAAVLAALGLALALQAWRGREQTAELRRRSAALDGRIARIKGANQAMRDEVSALENDPVYVESVLRRWNRAGTGERLVE